MNDEMNQFTAIVPYQMMTNKLPARLTLQKFIIIITTVSRKNIF